MGGKNKFLLRPPVSSMKRLLEVSGLPTFDLGETSMDHFFGLGSPELIDGVTGLELYGRAGFLRSPAVANSGRGDRVGLTLVVKAHGKAHRVQDVCLPTAPPRTI